MSMENLQERFVREAACFDAIAAERERHHQIPDLRAGFINEYFYNNIWRRSLFLRQEYGPRVRWIIAALKRARVCSVVEFGCGTGWLCLELARAGFNVTGVDISAKSIAIAGNYVDKLKEKKRLKLRYLCKNTLDYDEYAGETVVCFGFLHHLPADVLRKMIAGLADKMKAGQLLLAVEPRYDHASYEMAALIYALRRVLPNYFQYEKAQEFDRAAVLAVFNELREAKKGQSEMDNESPSDAIVDVIKEYFADVKVGYSSCFFDKFIGSVRVGEKDTVILAKLLKQLDEMIVKYNPDFARVVKIKGTSRKAG